LAVWARSGGLPLRQTINTNVGFEEFDQQMDQLIELPLAPAVSIDLAVCSGILMPHLKRSATIQVE